MQHLLSVNVTFHQTLVQENTRLVSDLQILVDEALTKKQTRLPAATVLFLSTSNGLCKTANIARV